MSKREEVIEEVKCLLDEDSNFNYFLDNIPELTFLVFIKHIDKKYNNPKDFANIYIDFLAELGVDIEVKYVDKINLYYLGKGFVSLRKEDRFNIINDINNITSKWKALGLDLVASEYLAEYLTSPGFTSKDDLQIICDKLGIKDSHKVIVEKPYLIDLSKYTNVTSKVYITTLGSSGMVCPTEMIS